VKTLNRIELACFLLHTFSLVKVETYTPVVSTSSSRVYVWFLKNLFKIVLIIADPADDSIGSLFGFIEFYRTVPTRVISYAAIVSRL
jgi:hypothetical protein